MKTYLELCKKSDQVLLDRQACKSEVRIAVLGDATTASLVNALRGSFAERSVFAEIYEAPYQSIESEILSNESELYRFKSDLIILVQSLQVYRLFHFNAAPTLRPSFFQSRLAHTRQLLERLSHSQSEVLLFNLALPVERQFGNLSLQIPSSLYRSVLDYNQGLCELVQRYSNVRVFDIQYWANRIGADDFLDEKTYVLSKAPFSPRHLSRIVNSIRTVCLSLKGELIKVVAVDLDGTLWGGVIGDDGLDGIELSDHGAGGAFQQFQRYLKTLQQRGYFLCVCSKNELETARKPFQSHTGMILKEEDISVFLANWKPKSENLREIASVLGVGLDSIVFLDDSSFEREEVRSRLPDVWVPELPEDIVDFPKALESTNLFETVSVTHEDSIRTQSAQFDQIRRSGEKQYASYEDYLRSLEMTLEEKPFISEDLGRIVQLIGRSNQFNLRTQRLTAQSCQKIQHSKDNYLTLTLSLRDRLGDLGLIAVAVLQKQRTGLFIEELLMSCRVLKRGVEEHLISRIIELTSEGGFELALGEFIPTPKNRLVSDFYDRFGFNRLSQVPDGPVLYSLNPKQFHKPATFFKEVNRHEQLFYSRSSDSDISTCI